MALTAVEKLLPSKFRGCLVGTLIGDCLGSPFEGEYEEVSSVVLKKYVDKLEGPYFKGKWVLIYFLLWKKKLMKSFFVEEKLILHILTPWSGLHPILLPKNICIHTCSVGAILEIFCLNIN